MKRIITVQDISCLGKCSLTVALPLISCYGIECCSLPTAVLSTHTQFSGFTFRDLTEDLIPIKDHWVKENFTFDGIYTGYLGSKDQLDIVREYIKAFKKQSELVFIDPVMADNGKLYKGFTTDFVREMAKLCSLADIIVPNLTETAFLLNEEYIESGYNEEYIKEKLIKLCGLGSKIAVITGVSFEKGKIGIMGYNSETKEYFSYFNDKVDASYHGTGDIFSSCAFAGMIKGLPILDSFKIAADFTAKCIKVTKENPEAVSYGVEFEKVIPDLISYVNR